MTIQIISTLGALTIGLAGIISTVWINRKLIIQKNNEDEKKEIYKKLNDFYGPFILLRKKSQMLYQLYSANKSNEKTTLDLLLSDTQIDQNDSILLNEIIEVGRLCEGLIFNKSGLVDDPYLSQNLLPQATTHFYILREVFNKNIREDKERFRNYSFPIDLDIALEKEVKRLKKRLGILNS